MAAPPATSLIHPSRIPNRWIQLSAGIVAMMAIANLQYAWTLFTKPIQAHLHVSLVALKWFPDHRGLCVGLTAGAFGIGTATTISPIAAMLKVSGYQHTFIVWGIIQGVVVLACALFLAKPPVGWAPPNWVAKEAKIKAKVNTSAIDMTPWQMMCQPSFYLIYVMMVMLAFGGLVVTAQLNPMASSYHVDKVIVLWGMTALVLAITVDRLLNGFTRPFWGWVSDHIGRENSIFIAFVLEAIAVFALLQL